MQRSVATPHDSSYSHVSSCTATQIDKRAGQGLDFRRHIMSRRLQSGNNLAVIAAGQQRVDLHKRDNVTMRHRAIHNKTIATADTLNLTGSKRNRRLITVRNKTVARSTIMRMYSSAPHLPTSRAIVGHGIG